MLKKIIMITVLLFIFAADTSTGISLENENLYNEDSGTGFSRIYVDGFGANSNGFKLILRTYERHAETNFKPLLADIEYILIKQEQIIYSSRVEQIPLSVGKEGDILDHQGSVALEEGNGYTALAKVYLYRNGRPEYYITAISNFTARNDAEITDVYGDAIGASATIRGMSMVPLNARINFTLTNGGRTVETKEMNAPSIMSNDKEKTVNILWDENLEEGTYIISISLSGKDLSARYDKIFTVDTKLPSSTSDPVNQSSKMGTSYDIPGFTSIVSITAAIILAIFFKQKEK